MNLERAQKIVSKNRSFYSKKETIDNNTIEMFSYTEGTPFYDFERENAFEMRGLTFVNGKAFPMLDKFFNIGEVKPLSYYLDLEVESIQLKEDGSLISFLILEDNSVIAKTQMGLKNDQTDFANNWLKLNNNEKKILTLYNQGIFPLFEYVGPKNKIVIPYENSDLILLQARQSDFSFLSFKELTILSKVYDFKLKASLNFTLQDILILQKKESDIEGFVIRFTNGEFAKAKTSWYFEQHKTSVVKDRAAELLVALFEDKKLELIDYEIDFFEDIIFLKNVVSNIVEFKRLMIDKDNKDRMIYMEAFNRFKKAYIKFNDIDSDLGLFNAILTNTLDDFSMSLEKRTKLNDIQSNFLINVSENVLTILDIFRISENRKEIASFLDKNLPGYQFKGVLFKLDQNSSEIEIRNAVLEQFENLITKKQYSLYESFKDY